MSGETVLVKMLFVFIYTPDKVVGNTGIDYTVVNIGKDIYIESHRITTFWISTGLPHQ